MKFGHLVKYNGVYYKPGQDVPMEEESSMGVQTEKVEEKPIVVVEETKIAESKVEEVKVEEVKVEETTETSKKYTKTEINRLSTAELKKLGKEVGIKNADALSGSKLKTMLIDRLV